MRGAFAAVAPLRARHVAIVDDVVTTGSTCDELARVLRQAGAEQIDVWAIARTERCRAVSSASEQVFERDADEDRHAEVVVVEECAEALLRLALANQQLLVQREDRRDREPEAVPQPELQLAAREPQREQRS